MEPIIDYIFKDQTQGLVANHLAANKELKPGAMRPFIAENGLPLSFGTCS